MASCSAYADASNPANFSSTAFAKIPPILMEGALARLRRDLGRRAFRYRRQRRQCYPCRRSVQLRLRPAPLGSSSPEASPFTSGRGSGAFTTFGSNSGTFRISFHPCLISRRQPLLSTAFGVAFRMMLASPNPSPMASLRQRDRGLPALLSSVNLHPDAQFVFA